MTMTKIKPRRIQRKRTKGFKLAEATDNPNGVVYVGRPTKWGNPYKAGESTDFVTAQPMTLADSIFWFRSEFDPKWSANAHTNLKNLVELKGKDLACFCPLDQPCHADVLLELANKD